MCCNLECTGLVLPISSHVLTLIDGEMMFYGKSKNDINVIPI